MADKLVLFDDLCRGPLWLAGQELGLRVMGVSIKVEPTGYLVVFRAVTAEGPRVAFVGCGTLQQVYRALQDVGSVPLSKWREDKYALDKKGT